MVPWPRAIRAAVTGASAANLLFIAIWGTIFQQATVDAFYLSLSGQDIAAAAINILAIGLTAGAATVAIPSAPAGRSRLVLDGLAAGSLLLQLNVLRQFLRLTPNEAGAWLGALPSWVVLGLAGIGVGLAGLVLLRAPGLTSRWVSRGYLALSPFLALTLGRSAWIAGTADLDGRFGPLPRETRLSRAAGPGIRVVLVIFDELDFRLAYPDRPTGIDLPAFDRLRRTALFAEQALPPAGNTNESMPSLLTGLRVAEILPRGPRTADLRLQSGDTVPLEGRATLFARARELGVNAAMVGWNLPYCRTGLGVGLVACDWWASGVIPGEAPGLAARMLYQWMAVSPWNSRLIHLIRHKAMLARGEELLQDPGLQLVVLHLAIPHYPWIYDARGGRFSLGKFGPRGYLDNLALADRVLEQVMRDLEATPLEKTVLIVTSDHAWRESGTYDGKRDPRVPFAVRFPGESGGAELSTPFNTVSSGAFCLAILRGQIPTRSVARAWLAEASAPR